MMDWSLGRFNWETVADLPAWAGFEPAASRHVRVVFAPEGRDKSPMTQDERALADWLPPPHDAQARTVLGHFLAAYPACREVCLTEWDETLPEITTPGGMIAVMTLRTVFIHQVSRGGVPFVGYEFDTVCDDEQGAGILLHGDRIVEVGGAEVAFLLWIAENDRAGKPTGYR